MFKRWREGIPRSFNHQTADACAGVIHSKNEADKEPEALRRLTSAPVFG
ncbi:MAG: hypothetical protein OP8BY_0059 [Candidatus Saccharicenans subterraneus]|uniref:Uncharacterized protein n=1 Tax=Candidatus Saccharicenans subterraneus TaxID=2508984 RepID=A0A3E2BLW3_9BACT|nr:MAG: hypothetical protein OP8BY_0059 [Candidatus Saccharicenans subterraneum]